MEEETKKTWIDEMLEREAIPEILRDETTKAFCERHGIAQSTYYKHASTKENQKTILETTLNLAKKHTPAIMENLGARAEKDNKAAELFMDYVLKLAKNLDIKSDGKPITGIEMVLPYVKDNIETNTEAV